MNTPKVLVVDTERQALQEEMEKYEAIGDKISEAEAIKLTELQMRWGEIEGDHAPHLASIILQGNSFC